MLKDEEEGMERMREGMREAERERRGLEDTRGFPFVFFFKFCMVHCSLWVGLGWMGRGIERGFAL